MHPVLSAQLVSVLSPFSPKIRFWVCIRYIFGYFRRLLLNRSHCLARWSVLLSVPAPRYIVSLHALNPLFRDWSFLQWKQLFRILSATSAKLFALLFAQHRELQHCCVKFPQSASFFPEVNRFCCSDLLIWGIEIALARLNQNPMTFPSGKLRFFPKVALLLFAHSMFWVYQLRIQHFAFQPEGPSFAAPAILSVRMHRFPASDVFYFVQEWLSRLPWR